MSERSSHQSCVLDHEVVSRRAIQDPGFFPLLLSPLRRSYHQMHSARGRSKWEVFKDRVWKWPTSFILTFYSSVTELHLHARRVGRHGLPTCVPSTKEGSTLVKS